MILKLEHIGKVDTATFNITQGVTTVLGPNGFGKSTIVNALYMALTGEPIDNCTLDEKVTWGYDTGTVMLKTDNWYVIRSIGKKSSVLLEDKSGTRLTKKAEVNDYILKWYNIPSFDILKEVYFSAQYKAIDILETTPAKRLEMLASVFGFAKYEKAQRYIYQHLTQMPQITYSEVTYNSLLEAKKGHEQTIKNQENIIKDAEEKLSELMSETDANAIINSSTVEELVAKQQARDKQKDLLENAEIKLQFLYDEKSRILSLRNKVDKLNEFYNNKDELEKLQIKMKEIEARMPHAVEKLKQCIDEDTVTKTKLEAELAAIEEQRDLLKGGICPLSKDVPCSKLLAITNPVRLESESDRIKKDIAILTENLVALKDMLKDSEKAYLEYVTNDAKQAVLKSLLLTVPEDVKNLEISQEDKLKVAEYSEMKTNKEIAELCDEIDKYKIELLQIEASLTNVTAVTEAAKLEAKTALAERTSLTTKILAADIYKSNIEEAYAHNIELINQMEQEKQLAEEHNFKRDVYTHARQILSKDNLPRILLENAINQLNTHLMYYINLFGFPYKCQVFSDGRFMYSDDKDSWHNTKLLSGGQKYMVSIMLKLASAATLKTDFPFYVLDEPTTGLDTENRRLLAELFKDMEEKINPLYLIIPTHDTEISDVSTNIIKLT